MASNKKLEENKLPIIQLYQLGALYVQPVYTSIQYVNIATIHVFFTQVHTELFSCICQVD